MFASGGPTSLKKVTPGGRYMIVGDRADSAGPSTTFHDVAATIAILKVARPRGAGVTAAAVPEGVPPSNGPPTDHADGNKWQGTFTATAPPPHIRMVLHVADERETRLNNNARAIS